MPAHFEKAPLLPAGAAPRRSRTASPPWARALLASLLLLVGASLWQGGNALAPALRPAGSFSWLAAQLEAAAAPHPANSDCPQQAPHVAMYPTPIPSVDTYAERLSRAVQLDTSVGDNWPSPADDNERWQTRFEPFRNFLADAFPRTHAEDGPVKRELVNSHALLYTWQGSDKSLKPILLTAHQGEHTAAHSQYLRSRPRADVVPVDPQTVGSWRFPPFSGHYENGTVWGRGSHDAKAWVIGIMSTLEALLDPEAEFSPARTIIVAFGFDEEASGPHGGGHLAKALEERLGKDSVALLLDEGTPNFGKNDALGMPVAIVAVEEKGQAHIALRIDTPGGHSSGAPVHTSIGMLASILTAMEKAPEERRFPAGESAPLKQLLCLRHSPRMPDNVRRALRDLAWARRSSIDVDHSSMSWLARAALALDRLTPSSGRDRRIKRAEQRVLEVLPRQLAK
jgi:Gly-Xaa carboxypeptidase